jgi:phosphopantothenoylcysteine decarboxylase/phosphopantothenate--cysteine ligase
VARRILLIIGGGIAAYKSLDLIRRLKERGHGVRVVLTRAAQEFVTPLAAGALSNDRVFTDLFDLDDEREIGHIRLSREADILVVAPATADLLAKMATGQAGDLATAVLLATDKPVLVAPAMNPRMWEHKATQRNVRQLVADGIQFVGPNAGEMAERGEAGVGRMAEAIEIADAVDRLLAEPLLNRKPGLLSGRHVLVTSGPTHEPIDPVRYIANRSSGKQGHAIAAAAAALGARVTLVSGPVSLAQPADVATIPVETADQMLAAVQAALPADIVICAAAVADWRVASAAGQKLKKAKGQTPPPLALAENSDILKTVAAPGPRRPALVIGFAAETEDVVAHAQKKRQDKGADWIVANDVSPATGTFGGDRNAVHLISATAVESWPAQSKDEVARQLVARAAQFLAEHRAGE